MFQLGLLVPGLFVAGALAASEFFGGTGGSDKGLRYGGVGQPDFDAATELFNRFLNQNRQPMSSWQGAPEYVSTGIPSVTVIGGLSDTDGGYLMYLKSKYGLSGIDVRRTEARSSSGALAPAVRVEFRT